MSYPPFSSAHRASVSSIASSSGDHYNPSASHSYSYGPPPSSTGSISPPPSPKPRSHSPSFSIASNRSRARRLSLLSSPLPSAGARRESDAFGGQAYDDALQPDEEEELGYELDDVDAVAPRGRRETFQPLTRQEKWWMGLSAAVVLALTVVSCVMTFLS